MSSSWPIIPLGNVLAERREVPSPDDIFNGEIPIVSKIGFSGGIIELREDGNTKTGMILIKPGDLVVSGINAAKGAIAIYDKKNDRPIAATIHYGAYMPNDEKVDVRYLWFFLRSRIFQEILAEKVPGGIKTELKAKRFLPIPIPLPPLPEQKRIIARIDELSTKIEKAHHLRHQAINESIALLNSSIDFVFEERLQDELIPKKLMSEACSKITDGAHHTPAYVDKGVPLLTAKNVFFDRIDTNNFGYISQEDHEEIYRRCPAEKGDILFINIGATTGTVKKIDIDLVFSLKNVALLKPDRTILDSDYLIYYLKGGWVRNEIKNKQSQTCQPFLSLRDLRNLVIPMPDVNHQHQIVKYLDEIQTKIDSLKKLQTETQKELNALLPSILDKAFKGEL